MQDFGSESARPRDYARLPATQQSIERAAGNRRRSLRRPRTAGRRHRDTAIVGPGIGWARDESTAYRRSADRLLRRAGRILIGGATRTRPAHLRPLVAPPRPHPPLL